MEKNKNEFDSRFDSVFDRHLSFNKFVICVLRVSVFRPAAQNLERAHFR